MSAPQLAQALAHHQAGRHAQALAVVRRYLTKKPNDPDANRMAALLCAQTGAPEQGLYHAQRAAKSAPDRAETLVTLGKLLNMNSRGPEAVEALERAVSLDPGLADAHMALGATLQHAGRLDDAIESMRTAAKLQPTHVETRVNLGLLHLDRAEAPEAVEALREATRLDPNSVIAWDTLALALNYDQRATPEQVFEAHKRYGHTLERAARAFRDHSNDPDPERRLRVGYLSRDMRHHSVAYFLQTILAAHDPDTVETHCYSTTPSPDDMTEHLRSLAGVWRDAGALDDAALAARIHDDRVDILVELTGHFTGHRLATMALRPAPVQVTYLGYPNTTGLTRIHARLVDARTDPEGADRFATERLVRLPRSFLCYAPPASAPAPSEPTSPLPMAASGRPTLGSFNDLKKLSDETVDTWAALLRELPDARLILKNWGFDTPALRERTLARFESRSVARDRIEIHGRIHAAREHLALYERIDLALDTFPYHGTTTTCEAAWMGVPTLTRAGSMHAGRVGVSLNTSLGLAEFIAADRDDYVSRGAALATDPAALGAVRARLRRRMSESELCDAPAFARDLERAYRDLWRAWAEKR